MVVFVSHLCEKRDENYQKMVRYDLRTFPLGTNVPFIFVYCFAMVQSFPLASMSDCLIEPRHFWWQRNVLRKKCWTKLMLQTCFKWDFIFSTSA